MNFNSIIAPVSLSHEMAQYMNHNYDFVYNHYQARKEIITHVFTLQYNKVNLLYVKYEFTDEEVRIKVSPYVTPYEYTEDTTVLRVVGSNSNVLELLSKETYILLKEKGITGLSKSW